MEKITYKKSFASKLVLEQVAIPYYQDIKDLCATRKKVTTRLSFNKETINFGRNKVAVLKISRKFITLCLALDPKELENTKYNIKDLSETNETYPVAIQVKGSRTLKHALELLDMALNKVGANQIVEAEHIDYMFKTVLQKENVNINTKVEEELYNAEMIIDTYNKDGQKVDRLIMIDKYMKAHPEFQEKYPVLGLLFNGSTPKTYEEIIADREMYKQNRPSEEQEYIDKMYEEIISLDPILALSHALKNNDIYQEVYYSQVKSSKKGSE